MRGLILLAGWLLASEANAAWTVVSGAEATTALRTLLSAGEVPDEAGLWTAARPMLAPAVYYGQHTSTMSEGNPHVRVERWLEGEARRKAMFPLALVTMGLAEGHACDAGLCEGEGPHVAVFVLLRRDPRNRIRVVGVFQVDSMLPDGAAPGTSPRIAEWRRVVEARYAGVEAEMIEAGLPPVELFPPSVAALEVANAQNARGVRALKRGQLDAAITALTAAVKADPAYHLARYNLACAYALKGKGDEAVAILEDLKNQPNCPACLTRVARAAQDPDFSALRGTPAFTATTSWAEIPEITVEAATEAVDRFVIQGQGQLAEYVDARRPLTLVLPDGAERPTLGFQLPEALRGLAAKGPLDGMRGRRCDAECCVSGPEPPRPGARGVQRVCVKRDGAGLATIARIELTAAP